MRWERLAGSTKCSRGTGMAGQAVRLQDLGEKLVALAQCALALKEDLQVGVATGGCAKAGEDHSSSQEASDEVPQHSQLPLSPQQLQTASSKAAAATHLAGDRDQPVLDGILKNQEALRKILMNQDVLKGLVDRLMKAVTNIEGRVQTIEQEMGLLSRFTEELNAVDTETNWS